MGDRGSPASCGADAFVVVPESGQEEPEGEAVGQGQPASRFLVPPWRRIVIRILRLFSLRRLWHCLGEYLKQFSVLSSLRQ